MPRSILVLFTVAGLALVWDILEAGRIAQLRDAPRPLAGMAGLAVLLAAPALLIAGATSSTVTGYSVAGVGWIWPATVAVFVAEALYVTVLGLVTPLIGVPIALYDMMLLAAAITRYIQEGGGTPPAWALAFAASYTAVIGTMTGPFALGSPYAILVPLIAPAFPARRRWGRLMRAVTAVAAASAAGALAAWVPAGISTVQSYDRYASDVLQERPADDFTVGVAILPRLDAAPPAAALRNDLALVDTTGAEAVSLVIGPDGARTMALDSLVRVLDPLRRDSTTLLVTLGDNDYSDRWAPPRLSDEEDARVAALERIARRLHPDYLLPAEAPCTNARDVRGQCSVAAWMHYFAAAAEAVHRVDPHIKVAVAIASFTPGDSVLYSWAAGSGSPIDAVGFRFFPAFGGAASLDAHLSTADRWMRLLAPPLKEQWVFAAGAFPAAHGEAAQELAIWGMLAWGTSRSVIKGVIVADAADYAEITGLRAPSGRLRPAAMALTRATRQLRRAP